MATCKRVPLRPTAMEAAAMTAGPVRNLTAIEKVATELPHAMILGCKAIKRPIIIHIKSIIIISHNHNKHKGDKHALLLVLFVLCKKHLSSSSPPTHHNINISKVFLKRFIKQHTYNIIIIIIITTLFCFFA